MTTTADEKRPADAVLEAMRQVWWAGLGLVAVAGEQAGKIVDTLVEKGREVEPSVEEAFKKAGSQFEQAGTRVKDFVNQRTGAAEAKLDERVAAALNRMGFPTAEDLRDLSARMDALAARLEQMQARWKGQPE
jgi:poly(hydroxyalkanoate) granule-associated protein